MISDAIKGEGSMPDRLFELLGFNLIKKLWPDEHGFYKVVVMILSGPNGVKPNLHVGSIMDHIVNGPHGPFTAETVIDGKMTFGYYDHSKRGDAEAYDKWFKRSNKLTKAHVCMFFRNFKVVQRGEYTVIEAEMTPYGPRAAKLERYIEKMRKIDKATLNFGLSAMCDFTGNKPKIAVFKTFNLIP